MLQKLNFINRDNIHFFMIGGALIFGLGSIPLNLMPPGGSVLFWWPTSYTMVWIGYCLAMLVLLLVARSQVLGAMAPNLSLYVLGLAIIVLIAALAASTLCRVSVYPDRIEEQNLTWHGLEHVEFKLADVTDVQYSCTVGGQRGIVQSIIVYQLNFPHDEIYDLAQGRNDHRDKSLWLDAVVSIDKQLMARDVKKIDTHAKGKLPYDNSRCYDLVRKERDDADVAKIAAVFQPNFPSKKKKAKDQDPLPPQS